MTTWIVWFNSAGPKYSKGLQCYPLVVIVLSQRHKFIKASLNIWVEVKCLCMYGTVYLVDKWKEKNKQTNCTVHCYKCIVSISSDKEVLVTELFKDNRGD